MASVKRSLFGIELDATLRKALATGPFLCSLEQRLPLLSQLSTEQTPSRVAEHTDQRAGADAHVLQPRECVLQFDGDVSQAVRFDYRLGLDAGGSPARYERDLYGAERLALMRLGLRRQRTAEHYALARRRACCRRCLQSLLPSAADPTDVGAYLQQRLLMLVAQVGLALAWARCLPGSIALCLLHSGTCCREPANIAAKRPAPQAPSRCGDGGDGRDGVSGPATTNAKRETRAVDCRCDGRDDCDGVSRPAIIGEKRWSPCRP